VRSSHVGMALSSGAAFGLAQIGVLKVFEEERIPIDAMAGVSIGALIGSLWATGKSATEIEAIMMEYNKDKGKVLQLLGDFCFPKESLISGQRIRQFLKKHLGRKTFRQTRVPLFLVASNLGKQKKIVHRSGIIAEAAYSSMAIPGMFSPHIRSRDLVVDGGVLEPVPVPTLVDEGVKKIIAVNVLPSPDDFKKSDSLLRRAIGRKKRAIEKENMLARLAFHGTLTLRKMFFPNIFDIMVNTILAMEYTMSQVNCQNADIILHPFIAGVNWFEFFRVKELIKKGEEVTRKNLGAIKACVGK